MSLDRPRKTARRIWADVTKKDEKAELKTKQTRGKANKATSETHTGD